MCECVCVCECGCLCVCGIKLRNIQTRIFRLYHLASLMPIVVAG